MKIGLAFNVRLASSDSSQPDSALNDVKAGMSDANGCLGRSAACPSDSTDEQEEFDSPETIEALAAAVKQLGHEVVLLGDGEPLLRRLLDGPRPDLVLNIAEGTGASRSREARVPAVLEMLNISYTGSDPLTLAATLDKDCAKRLVAADGIATPRWRLVDDDIAGGVDDGCRLGFPLVVKPAYEGSSKGILDKSVVDTPDELREALERIVIQYRQPALVEKYIEGDELTVGILGNSPPRVLGIMRVLPQQTEQRFIYSLEVKRDWQRRVHYECPARLSATDAEAVEQAALTAWKALGCRDVARIDFRLRHGTPYFLEANPLPGLSPVSGDLVLLAGYMGISHTELIAGILQAAIERMASCGLHHISAAG